MKKNIKTRFNLYFKGFISIVVVLVCFASVVMRVPDVISIDLNSIYDVTSGNSEKNGVNSSQKNSEQEDNNQPTQVNVDSSIYMKSENEYEEETTLNSNDADNTDKKKYPVYEEQYGTAGEITIKNSTNYTIDIEKQLSKSLPFEITDTSQPQVLIVHTHASEAFLQEDVGYYYEDYTSRSLDDNLNIISVGEVLTNSLNDRGIGTLQSLVHHDSPTYNGSYDRSEKTINEYLEKYPSIKVVIDLHRDAIGYGGEDGKYKPTFVVDGKKAAQIMVMTGYDPTGAYGYENWEDNLGFALKIQETAEKLYPGMTRPLYFGDFAYNMYINSGSLLVEVGTDANTLEEAQYTGELLGDVLAEVLKQ